MLSQLSLYRSYEKNMRILKNTEKLARKNYRQSPHLYGAKRGFRVGNGAPGVPRRGEQEQVP